MISAAASIPELLRDGATRFADRPAVVDGTSIVTYAELAACAHATARAYLAAGVRAGDRVAIWAPNRLEFVLALLGAQCAGASVVPLNTRYRGAEARAILQRSRAAALVVDDGFLGNDYLAMLRQPAGPDEPAGGALPGLPALQAIVDLGTAPTGTMSWPEFLSRGRSVSDAELGAAIGAVTPDAVADILFTSGTTGVPKGVMSSQRQTLKVAQVWARGAELDEHDRYAIINPFFHSFGYKAGIIAALSAGCAIYPVATFDPDALLDLVQTERITVLPGAPTIFITLINHPKRADYDLSSLRFAIAGAASVPENLFVEMVEVLGFQRVAQAYGLTECVVATQSRPNEDLRHVAQTTGPAVPGLSIKVVDAEGADQPLGADGEVLIRGDTVMLGYFEDPAATAAAIDPAGWLHTGDVGRLDEHGCLKITDRLKDVVIVGGFNVHPAEVENVLGAHPDVAEAAVIGVPDERLGAVCRAYVVPRPGAEVDEAEVIAHCRERLANFKVPREVVLLDALPRNASGKVLKRDLRGG
jgi:HIP---CoA ligase